jgi:hypothetical protein
MLLFFVLGFIPIVGLISGIVQIVIMCQDSDPGPNEYGPNPKSSEQAAGVFAGSAGYASLGLGAQPQPFAGGDNFCRACGAQFKDASSFCTNCGVRR